MFLWLLAGVGAQDCSLQGLPEAALTTVSSLAEASLPSKHASNLMGVLAEPCDAVKQGLLIMGFKMKNTASPLADFMRSLLDTSVVADVWLRVPSEPRTWMLKSFISSLPCKVSPGATKCDEEDTNAVLAKFEAARFEFTSARLAEFGMQPFATSDDDDAMRKYVARINVTGPAADWTVAQFNDTEPDWFAGIAARCRVQAHARVPGVSDADDSADLADLAAATRVAMWAWHFKACHRDAVLAAYDTLAAAAPDDQSHPPDHQEL